jgi:hypothetical protein
MGSFFAGLGFKLLGGFKIIGRWLSHRSPAELLSMALLILTIWLWISRGHARDDATHQRTRADTAEHSLADVCQATRKAAARPHLDCRQTGAQIGFLGSAIVDLKTALASQSQRIRDLASQTAAQQALSDKAEREATVKANRALSVAQRLRASAEKPLAPDAPCVPSQTLAGAWK